MAWADLSTLTKENLEFHENNLEILQKVVRFYFFFPNLEESQNGNEVQSSRRLGTRHKNDKVYWTQAKIMAQYKM